MAAKGDHRRGEKQAGHFYLVVCVIFRDLFRINRQGHLPLKFRVSQQQQRLSVLRQNKAIYIRQPYK
jgi:hypothetical protein